MSNKTHTLTYRGDLCGLDADGKTITFVTRHVEGKPSSLYQVDGESNKLVTVDLDFEAISLLRVENEFWIGGVDDSLHSLDQKSKKLTQHKIKLPASVTAMTPLSNSRIALVAGDQVVIVSTAKKAAIAQTIELDEAGSAVASNPNGDWFAVGTEKGTVCVYQSEESGEFEFSESEKLHEGAVRSLLFEPDELRFFSTGDDRRLLLTHARGRLEPEDRGRTNNHDDQVEAMVLAGEDRFITGGRDKTCKSWARAGATKPQTQASDLVAVTHLAVAEIHKRKNLVVGCHDNSLRLFLLKDDYRIGDLLCRYNDLYKRAAEMLQSRDPAVRGQAMQELAENDDRRAAEILAERVGQDSDNKIRLTATKLLAKSQHPQLADLLTPHLSHEDAPIRELVLKELVRLQPDSLVELYASAIEVARAEIGVTSIESLIKIAKDKKRGEGERNQAQAVIVAGMDSETVEIRNAALLGLENLFDKKSPRPNLMSLDSSRSDSKRKGLIRLFQRGLLKDENAAAGLRRAVEDDNPDVRQTAFLVSVLSRVGLSKALRQRDKDIDRQLTELEKFDFESAASGKKKEKAKKPAKSKTNKPAGKPKLAPTDYDPLLVAISSRAVDTCLMGARSLALLEDPRAFGLLMQLSREENADVRLETCRSFERLGDRRATDRLCALLDDEEVKVRDAAFTALGKICTATDDPLEAAAQGLAVRHEDIRLRGLELLVRHAKKSKANAKNSGVTDLLKQALNDSKSIRNEAFKFVLNSEIGGGGDATLRFALGSVHEDVRQDVLNEVIAEEKQAWAGGLIIELLNDPDSAIRNEVFEYLQKKNKNASDEEQAEWLSGAIATEHADTRLAACKRLVKINTPTAQSVLANAINDESMEVRQFALRSLIARNAVESLVNALESPHVGVRLSAATALARQGDSHARVALEEFAQAEMPDATEVGEEHFQLWEQLTTKALDGLAALENPETAELFLQKATHENAQVRQHAAAGLRWVAGPDSVAEIQPLMRHEDANVSHAAAYACALNGDLLAGRMVLATTGKEPLDSCDRLCVATALGEATENQLIQMLESVDNIVHPNSALLILLSRDWLCHDGTPRRIVAALAARDARLRLIAASALQKFSDSKSLGETIVDVFNNRSEEKPFEIDADVAREVAAVLVFGSAPLLCRVIKHLDTLSEKKQDRWNSGWHWLRQRYGQQIDAAVVAAEKQKLPKIETDKTTLDQLAFGTYVGLAREQGGYHIWANYPRFGWLVPHVRSTALRRLEAMADGDKAYLDPTISVVTHTCGDPIHLVRRRAFEILKELGVDDRRRAEIGISSGKLDLAIEGLNLLTKSAKKDDRKEILTQAIFNQPANIALQAAKMLREEIGSTATCETCLESSHELVARSSVDWLAEDYDKSAAKKLLQQLAMDSQPHVRMRAIEALVKHEDKKAFDAIASVASETNPKIERSKCYRWLSQLGDPRTSEFLLQLLDNKDLDLDHQQLLQVVGEFRDQRAVPKLLQLMERKELTKAAASVVLKISGFDQTIIDPTDALSNRLWMDSQHPRHGDVLANLLMRTLELNQTGLTTGYIDSARWCLTDEVDQPLSRLVSHPDDHLRRSVVEAISFRAEKRDGRIEPLKTAVEHRDPLTQFLAAEGLAKAGNAEGIQVLMSAVEMMEDLKLRRRSVLALGRLADERALDQLLKLVTHEGHALQDSAAEAIGRMAHDHPDKSEHKAKIFKILKSLVAHGGSAGTRALVGLRYLNVPEGWDLIRAQAKLNAYTEMQTISRQQLGYDTTDASKDLLIDLLEQPKEAVRVVLLESSRRCFGIDSIVPDIAYLKGRHENIYGLDITDLECLNRVCEHASPEQIFDLINRCPTRARQRLANHLLALDPLPVKESVVALAGLDAKTVNLAAHVVGRAADKKTAKQFTAALESWFERYRSTCENLKLQNSTDDAEFKEQQQTLRRLIWAAGRVGGSEKRLLEIVLNHEPDVYFSRVRQAAMKSLHDGKLTAADAKQLPKLLEDYDPLIRDGAGQLLLAQKKSNEQAVAEALLADRRPFDRMAADGQFESIKTFQTAAKSSHYQPRVLPHLITDKDHKTLAAVAVDDGLDLPSRLGAIEGLAKMSDQAAEKALVTIGKNESVDESLRKAAWRGLRRSKRNRELVKAK